MTTCSITDLEMSEVRSCSEVMKEEKVRRKVSANSASEQRERNSNLVSLKH